VRRSKDVGFNWVLERITGGDQFMMIFSGSSMKSAAVAWSIYHFHHLKGIDPKQGNFFGITLSIDERLFVFN